jgi:hypothetical protein
MRILGHRRRVPFGKFFNADLHSPAERISMKGFTPSGYGVTGSQTDAGTMNPIVIR